MITISHQLIRCSRSKKASGGAVHVLAGSADDAKEVFEAQTKGWVKIETTDVKVIVMKSPDNLHTMTFRDFSTMDALPPFTKINATIDVLALDVSGSAIKDSLIKIKFAE